MNSALSENEIEILRFLNEFGFCEIRHIIKQFEIKKARAYSLIQMLIQRGLVINARVIKYQPRAYYLTAKGIDLLKLDLPLVRRIPLNIYEHHLTVIDVYINLKKLYPDAVWMTERRLIRNKSGTENNNHLPDGALVFSDKQCAIEVEKTQKARDRLETIIFSYGLQRTYKEVWYFCSQSVMSVVNQIANNLPYIKTFKLTEFI